MDDDNKGEILQLLQRLHLQHDSIAFRLGATVGTDVLMEARRIVTAVERLVNELQVNVGSES